MLVGGKLIGGKYRSTAVTFDGSNDYMTNGFSGVSDTKLGIFSCWVKFNDGDGSVHTIVQAYTDATHNITIDRQANNTINFTLYAADGTVATNIYTTGTVTVSSGWTHVLASWDGANTTGHLYIDDSADLNGTPANKTIDYTQSGTYTTGATTAGGSKLDADIADIYFNTDEYLDLSSSANRRKFIDAAGKPVGLGLTGQLPTGSQPTLFLSLASDAAASAFATNKGSGGNLSITGALALASTSPSD